MADVQPDLINIFEKESGYRVSVFIFDLDHTSFTQTPFSQEKFNSRLLKRTWGQQ